MFGVIVNTLAVILGSAAGLASRRGIPEHIHRAVMAAIGLSTLYIGISGISGGDNPLIVILALVLGTAIGTLLDIQGAIQRLGDWAERRLKRPGMSGPGLGEGFVTASLLFCVGSMTVVGSFNAGLRGDHSMLLTKSLLDMVAAALLSVTLGAGVMLASVSVLVLQGGLVLFAGVLRPLLSEAAIAQMSLAGALMIMGLGLNLLGITRIKVADMMPALVLAPVFSALAGLL